MKLRDSELQDEEARAQLFQTIIGAVHFEENYLLLLAHEKYDVPYKAKDGSSVPLVRKNPALSVLKEATAQIRALSDLLGISPRCRAASPVPQQPRSANAKLLTMVLTDREAKARKAAGA